VRRGGGKYCSPSCHTAHRQKPLAERFWEKVEKTASCWLWNGYRNPGGYGQVNIGSRGDGMRLAHRVSWELHYGTIPEDMNVLHRCDTPSCVNPSHLFLGTDADNVADMMNKGRGCTGERNGHAKLTADDVRAIRYMVDSGESYRAVAMQYGVSPSSIYGIANRRRWKHI
jgi:hypothetical protein